jgi:PadR family transcriptional regulator PadR
VHHAPHQTKKGTGLETCCWRGGLPHKKNLLRCRLGGDAYGVPIRREIEKRCGCEVTGALYSTLDRLQAKCYLSSWFADPTAERWGLSRRYFRLEPAGVEALGRAKSMFESMWKGVRLA